MSGSSWESWWVDSHKNTSDFYLLACQSSDIPVPLLLLRGFTLSISCIILIWAVCFQLTPLWFVYLTNWGLMCLVFMNLMGFIVSFMAVWQPASTSETLPWYVQWFWLSSNVGTTMVFLVTLLYFILIFDPIIITEFGWQGFFLDLSTHGLTSILVLIELILSRTPVYFCHFYQPLCVGLWYAVFTAIFYVCGGTVNGLPFVYDILNWEYPKRTSIVVTFVAIALLFMYLMVWVTAKVKSALVKDIVTAEMMSMAESPSNDPIRYI